MKPTPAAVMAAVGRRGTAEVEEAGKAPSPSAEVGSLAPSGPIALEDERDFCLRSLRDLDAEWEAGDIDAADYRALKDAYTARAAAALHALEGGEAGAAVPVVDTGPARDGAGGAAESAGQGPGADRAGAEGVSGAEEGSGADRAGAEEGSTAEEESTAGEGAAPARPRRAHSRRRAAAIGIGVVAAAGVAAWAVAASSATRLPGEEVSGVALGPQALAQSLQQAQQAADKGDDLTAVKDFQKILDRDPSQTEALTGEGWLLAQTQEPTVLQQGLTMLQQAERTDPAYAPAHVYRGIALLSEDDYTDAIPELTWYLAHSPDPQLVPQVRAALQQAEAAAAAARAKG